MHMVERAPTAVSRLRRFRLVVVGVASIMASLFWSSGVAAASNSPCADANAVNRFDAYLKTLLSVVSAEAQIEGQAPLLCIGPDGDSGSFTWVGVQVSGSQRSIYQMGVAKCLEANAMCTGAYRIFYAWGRDDSQGSCTSDVDPIPKDLGAFWPSHLHGCANRNLDQIPA